MSVVILERTLENLIDVWLGAVAAALQFGVKTFLNDVARKFKLTESDEIFCNLLKDLLILLSVFKLNDVLNEIVAIRIFNQLTDVSNDEVCKLKLLSFGSFFKASLHDAASMLVLSNWNTVVNASLEDEVGVLAGLLTSDDVIVLRSISCLENHKQGLNDMVSMHVDSKINNLLSEFNDHFFQNLVILGVHFRKLKSLHVLKLLLQVVCSLDDVNLRVDSLQDTFGQSLDQDLDNSSTMNIQRYLHYVVLNVSD